MCRAHQYGPELEERVRHHLKSTTDSWRVDEIYIKVKGQWMHLYRAVDSEGNTIDFYLSKEKNKQATKRLLKNIDLISYFLIYVIAPDKNLAYPTATYILSSIEAMNMIKRKQVHQEVKSTKN